jgi:hypothetical protein
MTPEPDNQLRLEIGHVLFTDIVGYSKLSVNEQHRAVEELNQIGRLISTAHRAGASGMDADYNIARGIIEKIGVGKGSCTRIEMPAFPNGLPNHSRLEDIGRDRR